MQIISNNDNKGLPFKDRFLKCLYRLPPPIPLLVELFINFGLSALVGILFGLLLSWVLWGNGVWSKASKVEFNSVWQFNSDNIILVYPAKSVVEARIENKSDILEEGVIQPIKLSDGVEASFYIFKTLAPGILDKVLPKAGDLTIKEFKAGDIIIVGGPRANLAYIKAIKQLESEGEVPIFNFTEDAFEFAGIEDGTENIGVGIKNRQTNSVFYPKYEKIGTEKLLKLKVDYGFFIFGHNPYKFSSKLLIIAGVHKLGTFGVSQFLTDNQNRGIINEQVQKAQRNNKYLTGLIEICSLSQKSKLIIFDYF